MYIRIYWINYTKMIRIIRNKLSIIPKTTDSEAYKKQIDDVFHFCRGELNGTMKEMNFHKIAPIPEGLVEGSKEKDDWLLTNWGTRNVAYNACWVSDFELIFDTFTNPAIPIAYRIMKHFPDIDFSFKFASDHTGTNAGEVYTDKGSIFFNQQKDFSKDAFEMAFELRPHLRALFTLVADTNTYKADISDIIQEIENNGFYKDVDGTMLIGTDDKQKPLFNSIDDIDDLPF